MFPLLILIMTSEITTNTSTITATAVAGAMKPADDDTGICDIEVAAALVGEVWVIVA